MRRRLGFRKSFRDQIEDANKADRYYALMAGKEPQNQTVLPPKRERAAPRKLEAPVVAAISELLAVHPRVLFAVRQNSGAAGEHSHIHFYRILTHGKEITIVDFWGFLKDGRFLAIEAKAPGFKGPHTDREMKQFNFLQMVRNCGGIALFADSIEDVTAALA